MTGQGFQNRVKTEPTKNEVHGGMGDDTADVKIPSPDNLLEIPLAHACQRLFPPGCPVLYTTRDLLIVSTGVVESVSIELTLGCHKGYFYKLAGKPVTVAEDQLQYAPQCRVWVKLLQSTHWTAAVIRGSYQEKAAPLYSVQLLEPANGLYHGMAKDFILYRSESSDPPIVHSGIQQKKPMNAEMDETSSSLPEPPSDVNTLLAPSDETPTSPSAATANELDNDSGVSDMKPRKRSLPLDRPLLQQTVSNEPKNMPLGTSAADRSSSKKAKVAHPTPEVASETKGGTATVALTSKVFVQNSNIVSEDTKREQEVTHPSPHSSGESKTSLTHENYETGYEFRFNLDDIEEDERTLTITVPKFADPDAIKAELIGDNGKRHKALVNKTRCSISLLHLNSPRQGPNWEPIEVKVMGAGGRLQHAARLVEDKIVGTVPEKQRGRMLYLLAAINNYGGSSYGCARLQRLPNDLDTWVWMAVVTVPRNFEKDLQSLFISRGGTGIKAITNKTKCRHITIINCRPTYIFLTDSNEKAVNEAVDAVQLRLQWAKERHAKNNE